MLFRLMLGLTFSGACAMRAADASANSAAEMHATAHVDDAAGLLREVPQATPALEKKLADFEHATGVKILARFHPQSPAPEEDAKPGVFMHALATRFGVARGGVLAVYFADEDDWRVWIGDDLTAKFVGRPGTVEELTESDAIHNTKEAFFAAAKARSDAATAAEVKPMPAVKLKLQTDAILDGLIVAFGRK